MIYRFYSKPISKRRVTVIGKINNGYLELAIAISNKNDTFVRKIGRAIAEGRLNAGKLHAKIVCTKDKLMSEEYIQIAEEVANNVVTKLERKKK